MTFHSVTCPICGAKIPHALSPQDFVCPFCNFEHRTATGTREHLIPDVRNLNQLLVIKHISSVYLEEGQAVLVGCHPVDFSLLSKDTRNIEAIWADRTLPFQKDMNQYFQEKFHQLTPGGLLYLSTPVTRYFQKVTPLPGQINFFKAKNIMFLLEQHGFKMAWRQNRFSSTLRLIARRN